MKQSAFKVQLLQIKGTTETLYAIYVIVWHTFQHIFCLPWMLLSSRRRSDSCLCFGKNHIPLISSGFEPNSVCHLQSCHDEHGAECFLTLSCTDWNKPPHAFPDLWPPQYFRATWFLLHSRDKWLPFGVLEFGKRQAEIMGGKGHLGVVFSSVSVGALYSKVKARRGRGSGEGGEIGDDGEEDEE